MKRRSRGYDREAWKMSELLTPACACSLLNIVSGALSILATITGHTRLAVSFITLSFVADSLDGFLARRYGWESDFGLQLDSLSDMVSFTVAPALLIVEGGMLPSPISYAVAVALIACGGLRLARFNVMCAEGYPVEGYYLGLPVPWVGMLVVALYTLGTSLSIPKPVWWAVNGVLVPSATYLMISSIEFPSVKRPPNPVVAFGGLSVLGLMFDPAIPVAPLRNVFDTAASIAMLFLILIWYPRADGGR